MPVEVPAVRWVEVDADTAGQRIDNFLISRLKGVPKSRVYRLLRKGEVRVNRGRIKADYKLAAGDQVRIPPVRLGEAPARAAPGDQLLARVGGAVIYQDDWLMALNKPSGLPVHGGTGINLGLIEVLRHRFPQAGLELVHRLDKDTSGLLLVAKGHSVLRNLQRQFRRGGVQKRYTTLVTGHWPRERGRVELPLLKNQPEGGERIVRVSEAGKAAATDFRLLETIAGASLLEARPITGRTHQIRVHCQHSGHPIAGDDKYGRGDDNKRLRALGLRRLFLHASELTFRHPGSGEVLTLEAPLYEDLAAPLAALRSSAH